ncbi:MAG: LacI family DNA-binding transcriptional regulator [Novosphingobium sp.]
MSTIADVAAKAGVSIKTVSKVLNGASTVRPRLKQRIMDAMKDLDYRPALAARQLASGKSYIVALLMPFAEGSYYTRIILAMTRACAKRGYHAIIETLDFDSDLPSEAVLRLSCNPDAIVVAPPFSNNLQLLEKLNSLGVPFVRIAANGEGPGYRIAVAGRAAARDMTAHLISQGHKRIAMLAPPGEHFPADDRRLGYLDALADAGIAIDPQLVVRTKFGFPSGAIAVQRLLALADRPTAIFAGNDLTALGAMAKAQELGYRIPQDLAIAGFDNSADSRTSFPALTSVHQPVEEVVNAAVDVALGKEIENYEFPFRLVVRGSTGGPEMLCMDDPAEDLFADMR